MINTAKFGTGGFPPSFYESEYSKSKYGKRREGIFPFLHSIGLDWLELECTHGVKMPNDQAIEYRRLSEIYDIELSIHAPFYCCLASENKEIRERSKKDLIACFDLATILKATRIIFHPGYPGTNSRNKSIDMIIEALNEIKKFKSDDICIYPEIGGKVKSLGSLDEIISICKNVDYAYPCLDLAHLHARELGSLTSTDSILNVLNIVESELGIDGLKLCHYHVYPVEYNDKGETVHRAFPGTIYIPGSWATTKSQRLNTSVAPEDKIYPMASHFIEAIKIKQLNPIVICEAKNSQDKGAVLMKNIFKLN